MGTVGVEHPELWPGTCVLSQGHWGAMAGFRAREGQHQTPAAFWRVDSRVVRPGHRPGGGWALRNKAEPGSGTGPGEVAESTVFGAILEARWNIHGGGCQDGGGAGSWASRAAQKVMGGGGEWRSQRCWFKEQQRGESEPLPPPQESSPGGSGPVWTGPSESTFLSFSAQAAAYLLPSLCFCLCLYNPCFHLVLSFSLSSLSSFLFFFPPSLSPLCLSSSP